MVLKRVEGNSGGGITVDNQIAVVHVVSLIYYIITNIVIIERVRGWVSG